MPGTTLLNEPAYDEIFDNFSAVCTFDETVVHFKNEGSMTAYSVKLNGKKLSLAIPEWMIPNMANEPVTGQPSKSETDEPAPSEKRDGKQKPHGGSAKN
jgi:hypothetical protein